MAARESEYPAKGRLPGGAGGRPLPVGAAGSDGRANGSAPSNRPIPLGPKDALPQPFEDDGDEKDDMQEILRNAPAWLVSTVFHRCC